MKLWLVSTILGLLLLLLPLGVVGQDIKYSEGTRVPETGRLGDLFLETSMGTLFQFGTGSWQVLYPGKVLGVTNRMGYYVVETQAEGQMLVGPTGVRITDHPTMVYDGPAGILYRGAEYWTLIKGRKEVEKVFPTYDTGYKGLKFAMYLDGKIVSTSWAGSWEAANLVHRSGATAVGFGLVDDAGFWVIEPLYDKPFFFQGGRAEVELYGEKFWINEQGRRVE